MGVRILHDTNDLLAALYCSTSEVAFGPLFHDDDNHDAVDRAEAFLRWLKREPRRMTDAELMTAYSEWRAQETAQWQAELDAEEA